MAKPSGTVTGKVPDEVEVVNEGPLLVEVVPPAPLTEPTGVGPGVPSTPVMVKKDEGVVLAPTTTEQQDVVTAGQRRINTIWEVTQASISLLITLAVIYCAIFSINSDAITNAFFFIIATYFTRTNHTRIGGVGEKANEPTYRGR